MSFRQARLAPLAMLLATAPAFVDLAQAQVPEGSAVVCTFTLPGTNYLPGAPGLFLVPLAGGPMTRVTGLPLELRTDGLGAYGQGAAAVSIRCADGAVIVSTISGQRAPTAGTISLFVLHLNGAAVVPARTQQIVLGTASTVGEAWHAVLPDGRILVVAADGGAPFTTGPMAGSFLAIVDTSGPTPTFTLLPNPSVPLGGGLGGLAVDPSGSFLYFTYSLPTPSLYRHELTTGTTCPITSWPGHFAGGVRCDDDGTVYVSTTDPTPTAQKHFMHAVVPNGCNPATFTTVRSSQLLHAWGLDLDRASGRFAATSTSDPSIAGPQFNALSLIDPVTGNATVVASAPAGGWGSIAGQGVAVNNAIESYGAPSDGLNRYWFENFPNPGGQPTIGNAGFTLTMKSGPGTAAVSALALSLGRGSTTMLGVDVLVDLASTVVQFLPPGQSVTYALPVPNNPVLRGLVVTAQSLHLEAGNGLATSRGLMLTL